MNKLNEIKAELKSLANKEKAEHSARFFKTREGEYGERDKFLGITVPEQRKLSKKYYKETSLDDIQELLMSDYHEFRLTALLILVIKFERSNEDEFKKSIFEFYLKNTKCVNNWDLVDTSAHKIVGGWLNDKTDRSILYKLSRSDDLWEQRISIIATLYFIKNDDLEDTFSIAELLMDHPHDLIHKATGWMIREAGKKNKDKLLQFLDEFAKKMPRTMLRYSIEKLSKEERIKYMNK